MILCLIGEIVTGGLRGHLAANGEDSAPKSGYKVADMGIGAVNDVPGGYGASACLDHVSLAVGGSFIVYSGHGGVFLDVEVIREVRKQTREDAGDEFVGPEGTCGAGDDTSGTSQTEFLETTLAALGAFGMNDQLTFGILSPS